MPELQVENRIAPVRRNSYVIDPRTGQIKVDPGLKDVSPFWLTTEPEAISIPGATQMCPRYKAGGVPQTVAAMPIDDKGPLEIFNSAFSARFTEGPDDGLPTDQFTVAIFDPQNRPLLMNREIHARTIGGGFGSAVGVGAQTAYKSSGGRPFIFPESFFLDPQAGGRALFLGFRNLTEYAIDVKWVFAGVRYWHLQAFQRAYAEKQKLFGQGFISYPYFLTTDTDALLTAGESRDFDIRITDEAAFELFKMNHYATYPFLWRLQEKMGKRFLDSAGQGLAGAANGVHSDFGWGDAEYPFIPFETLYMEKNEKLILQLVNAFYPYDNYIFVTLSGRKISRQQPTLLF